ncbi:MAG TPA: serine/threonine-protein kinase, partial [Conexibacter sp.]|nr:serine/threonine-protein kinase [Conexibacter sp.]
MTHDARIGTTVAGCRIDGTIGQGGMGIVYRAEQLALGRVVALKLLSQELAGDPEFRARFQEEARLAASLDHPHVVPIHAAGESEDGDLYIVMRYVEGGDLRGLLREHGGRLPPQRATALIAQVGDALDAAHARGLVHRDVKPANVLVGEGGHQAYLSDFGLSKPAAASGGLTRTGQWLGTIDYCAPEQIEGRRVDARTDVYALGCLLFHVLTGTV